MAEGGIYAARQKEVQKDAFSEGTKKAQWESKQDRQKESRKDTLSDTLVSVVPNSPYHPDAI